MDIYRGLSSKVLKMNILISIKVKEQCADAK